MEKKQTSQKPKKVRVKSVPMNGQTLDQIKNCLLETNTLIDHLENTSFIFSIHKNTDMALKKVYHRLGSAKKTELLKAIRDGKDVQIIG